MTALFRLATLALAIAIMALSLQPSTGVTSFDHADKVHHFVAYFSLTAAAGLGWRRAGLLVLAVLVTLFGVAIELAQAVMPLGRFFSLLDMLANAAGAGAAALSLRAWRAR